MTKKNVNQLEEMKNVLNQAANIPAQTYTRVRSRAIELAVEEDREDRYARQTALQLAATSGEPHELVVERAKAYFDFLRGQ